jgi:hypothetical protein
MAGLWGVLLVLASGCGRGQTPTESNGLAETRRGEAREAPRPAEVIDALFLGTGPLIPRDGLTRCPTQAIWSGYPRGTAVRVRLGSRVPAGLRETLEAAVAPLSDATGGALVATIEPTADPDPQPGVNEVTVTEAARPRSAGCSSDAGCVEYRFAGRGLLMGARVIGPPGRSFGEYVRDTVGHATLGLCRIDARLIGGPENSLMSSGPERDAGAAPGLTGLDLEAIRAVYASSLNPGAPRSAFLAARLVNLQAGQLPRPR